MQQYNESPTIKDLLAWAARLFMEENIATPRLEAELLLAYALGCGRTKLHMQLLEPVEAEAVAAFQLLVDKRLSHFPIQYLLGEKEFMSLSFRVSPACLIPRDDTQILVDACLAKQGEFQDPLIVEVGTGSGIIAICLKKYWPQAEVIALDISPEALQVAQENAARHQAEIAFRERDFLTAGTGLGEVDLIVSNPPYIRADIVPTLQREVQFEPEKALVGGEDGLIFYHALAAEGMKILKPKGLLAVEIGCEQGAAVQEIFSKAGFTHLETLPDFQGLDRVVLGRRTY